MKLHGSPRRQVRRSGIAYASGALVIASAVVLVHDAVNEFGPDSVQASALFRATWIGPAAAASLFVACVSLFVARRQFAINLYPWVAYSRGRTTESKFALSVPGEGLWFVEVRNDGGGLAVLADLRYDVELADAPASARSGVDFATALAVVESTGAVDERDFVMSDVQAGAAIRPGATKRLWEFPLPVARRLRRLDAHLRYRSLIGDEYILTLSCIPPRGIPAPRGN